MDHDRLFKELLTTFFVEFLELFFPETLPYLDRDSVEFLDNTGSAGGVFDPAGVARAAKVKRQPAVDLLHQVGLGQVARLVDEAIDLGVDVAC